ncbi:MAG: trypsin-like peptidase domain-containing protein, partial [Candidatus Eisenbacteria sp.]|nr:trypsin-like peptidase domain-containing protein [Candidatus Eisenbacteria bacterium]
MRRFRFYGSGECGRIRVGVLLIVFLLGLALGGGIVNRLAKLGSRHAETEMAPDTSAVKAGHLPVTPSTQASTAEPVDGSEPLEGVWQDHAATSHSEELDPYRTRRTAVVEAAERVAPAVVSISVTQIRLVRHNPFATSRDPFDRFFSRFFPGQLYGQEIASLGSGVIIDERGIVVTNEHVVREAKEIKVSLPDGRTFDASIVGMDASYDLAVLRIEGEDLPVAPVGDSETLIVGEWAIAMGNPFGFLLNDYHPTVTAGVISATHRDLKPDNTGQAVYKNMIQTDAAI